MILTSPSALVVFGIVEREHRYPSLISFALFDSFRIDTFSWMQAVFSSHIGKYLTFPLDALG